MEVNKLALRVSVMTALIHGLKRSFRSARTFDEGGTSSSSVFTVEVLGIRFKVTIKEL